MREAIEEYKGIGQERFLQTFRFRPGRYWLIEQGARYESKAILGVAHDKFACERTNSTDYITRWKREPGRSRFSGGEQTKRTLEALGFTIYVDRK